MFDLEGLDEWMEGRDMFAVIEVEGGEFHIIVVEGSVYGGEVIDVRSRDLTHLAAQRTRSPMSTRQETIESTESAVGCSLGASPCSAFVFSAHIGDNDKCFAQLMALHVPDGATVADVTYGRGNFWKCVPHGKYDVKATDLADGVDCRNLPYGDATIDAVVLDPPYIAGFFRPHKVGEAYQDFTHRYSAGFAEDGPRYHDGVLALYGDAAKEAWRVLKPDGKLVLKCQDEVHAGRQYLTHIEIVNALAERYHAKDLFVVVRNGGNFATRGRAKRARQQHARKNHSYFLVFEKRTMNTPNSRLSRPRGTRSR